MRLRLLGVLLGCACVGTAAGDGVGEFDARRTDAGLDAGPADSGIGTPADSGSSLDGGSGLDAGVVPDAGVGVDAGGSSSLWAQLLDPDADVALVVGETLTLLATADGGAPPLTFTWTSSLDGVVASTAQAATSSLRVGDHQLTLTVADARNAQLALGPLSVHVLPAQFDWSHRVLPGAPPAAGDWMTPVKNQLTCGSCWSHAALGAMEAMWNIQNKDPMLDLDLSEQYLIDCHHEGAVGCGGGAPEQALDFIASTGGVPEEGCDPFQGHNTVCSATCADGGTPRLWHLSGRQSVLAPMVRQPDGGQGIDKLPVQRWMRDRLVHVGPIPHALDGIVSYSAATSTCADYQGSHYVVIVGYDHPAGLWIAKNSWGSAWNGNGYMKIAYGACGMDASATALGTVIAPK